jgi:hypothetical protein
MAKIILRCHEGKPVSKVDIPENIKPGKCKGIVTVEPDNEAAKEIDPSLMLSSIQNKRNEYLPVQSFLW